jgi:hypothetical protein
MVSKKIKARTDNSGWKEPNNKKVRKKRKPMTENQRQAAAERLKKAREVRAAKNPNYGMSGIHESLRNLPDEHPASPKKVKQWIKTQKELISSERRDVKNNIKGAYARQKNHEGYVRNLINYLRSGDYIDSFYGEYQEHSVKRRCVVLAYDNNGNPKRNIGVYYPDMGCVYTKEIYEEDHGIFSTPTKKKKRGKKKK